MLRLTLLLGLLILAAVAGANIPFTAQWKFNGNGNDSAGSNNLTGTGSPTFVSGKLGQATQLVPGSGQFWQASDAAGLRPQSSDFCISAWVLFNGTAGTQTIVEKSTPGDGNLEYWVNFQNGFWEFGVSPDGSSNTFVQSTYYPASMVSTGTWYLVQAWIDTTRQTINISINNGPPNTKSYSNSVYTNGAPLNVGRPAWSSSGNGLWNGMIDDLVIAKGAGAVPALGPSYAWWNGGSGAETLPTGAEAAPAGRYIMACFIDPGNSNPENLRILRSSDGISWATQMCVLVNQPSGHVVRDPSMSWDAALGKYVLACTNVTGFTNTSTNFDVYTSPDLFTWTWVASPSCTSISGVNRVWAPHQYVAQSDGSVHYCLDISTDGAATLNVYEIHPTNGGYTAWSSPAAMGGVPTGGVIGDPDITFQAGEYYLFCNNNSYGSVVYSSPSASSGYSAYKAAGWTGWSGQYEGWCAVQLPNGHWRLYEDVPGSGPLHYSDMSGSTSLGSMGTWPEPTAIVITDQNITTRHGSVILAPPATSAPIGPALTGVGLSV
ncbi:MAG TPA: hypothetical protein VKT78_13555 [Fimbriimonadaceae bacterium]|nr:hypothetical protein [Fimbriimonadaceae bacterium]